VVKSLVKANWWFRESQNTMRQQASEKAGYHYLLLKDGEVFSKDLHSIIEEFATSARHNQSNDCDDVLQFVGNYKQ
jgi:hypothetical protein